MNKLAKLIVLFLVLLCFPALTYAEDSTACLTVYPCLENGEIMPEFNLEGYCGDQYRLLCSKVKASQLADELVSCQNENVNFKDTEAKLSKQIRSLRKKLRRTK